MLAQGQYLTGAMIYCIFRDKPIYVWPTQQILKPPKQCKTGDNLDDNVFQVTNGNLITNGNLEVLSSMRATGGKAANTVNFPSVTNSCSDNDATNAMGSGLPSTSGSAPTSDDEMNAITDSSEQYQQPLPNAYENYIGALYDFRKRAYVSLLFKCDSSLISCYGYKSCWCYHKIRLVFNLQSVWKKNVAKFQGYLDCEIRASDCIHSMKIVLKITLTLGMEHLISEWDGLGNSHKIFQQSKNRHSETQWAIA